MRLISMTDIANKTIYINPEHVKMLISYNEKTTCITVGRETYKVKGKIEEVAKILQSGGMVTK